MAEVQDATAAAATVTTSVTVEMTEVKTPEAAGESKSQFSKINDSQAKSTSFNLGKAELKNLVTIRQKQQDSPEGKVFTYKKKLEDYGGINGMLGKLNVDLSGIDESTIEARQESFGPNTIPEQRLKTFCELCFEALQDFTLILLMVSGTVQLILAYASPETAGPCHDFPSPTHWIEPFTIYLAVAVVCLVAAGTDYAKQGQLKKQQEQSNKMNTYGVVRRGKAAGYEIEKSNIVVGDILNLKIGDIVPVDGFFLKGADLQLDESALTGEPKLMKKDAVEDPWLLSGTKVQKGSGTILVMCTGKNSVSGEITMKVRGIKDEDDDHVADDDEETGCFRKWAEDSCMVPCVQPPPEDPDLQEFLPAKITEVKSAGRFAFYKVQFTNKTEWNGKAKYTENIHWDQIQELLPPEDDDAEEKKGGDVEEGDGDNEGGSGVLKIATLQVGQDVHVKASKEHLSELEEEIKSALEMKLDTMATNISLFGAGLALFSMLMASIIWAILKFGNGRVIASAAGHGTHKTYLIDASFWAGEGCSDQSLLSCFNSNNSVCDGYFVGGDPQDKCKEFSPASDPSKIVRIFVTGVTILVVAIPEGLPLAVTLAIAFSQRKLYQLNNFVKTLDSCETMGSATTICSDKTGTLTQNRMTVVQTFLGMKNFKADGGKGVGAIINEDDNVSQEVQKLLAHSMAINSSDDSQLVFDKETQLWTQAGNKTECGMLGLVKELGHDYAKIRQDPAYAVADNKLRWGRNDGAGGAGNPPAFPFSSERKRMSTLVPHGEGSLRLHCKGASEVVLERCNKYLDGNNEPQDINEEQREMMLEQISKYADDALRTLCVAYRDIPIDTNLDAIYGADEEEAADEGKKSSNDNEVKDYAVEHDMILVGIIGIQDPLREGVKEAIVKCFRAGVDVRMVTGDNIRTAIAISTNAGILREEHYHHVFEGRTELYNDSKFKKYFAQLTRFIPLVEVVDDMKRARISAADIKRFEKACAECRGKKIGDNIVTNPVQCLRKDFAMEGAEFAKRVHYGNVPKTDIKAFAPAKSYGEPVKRGGVNQEEFDKIWPKLRCMARCQPHDKLCLVNGLMVSEVYTNQKMLDQLHDIEHISIYPDKQVVAVTGDGTNDAPALKKANVGFAMGIEGTQTAKDASNIILMKDNFADIVIAMKWGRNIYDSIQKFIQFQLTVNIVACILACVGAILFQESPLGAVQMLWVNLVMDSLASLALATEPPTEDLLKRRPYGRHESIIKRGMWVNMIGQAAYQLIVSLIILFRGHIIFYDENGQTASGTQLSTQTAIYDEEKQLVLGWFAGCDATQHYTMLFNTFVVMTLFNQVPARKLKGEFNLFAGMFNNPFFVVLLSIEFAGQVVIAQCSGEAFGVYSDESEACKGLTGSQWGYGLLFGAIGWVWQEVLNVVVVKCFPVKEEENVAQAPGGQTSKASGIKKSGRGSTSSGQLTDQGQRAMEERVRAASQSSAEAQGVSDDES